MARAGSRQYCRYNRSSGYLSWLKEIWKSPRLKKIDFGGVWTYDLRIRCTDALPTAVGVIEIVDRGICVNDID